MQQAQIMQDQLLTEEMIDQVVESLFWSGSSDGYGVVFPCHRGISNEQILKQNQQIKTKNCNPKSESFNQVKASLRSNTCLPAPRLKHCGPELKRLKHCSPKI